MRTEDDSVHPAAVERQEQALQDKLRARQRLIGSTLIGLVGLLLVFREGQELLGMGAAALAFGLLSVSDLKAWLGK